MQITTLLTKTGVAVISILFIAMVTSSSLYALTLSSSRDCDSNAVLRCGALTTSELRSKFKQQDAGAIYKFFGISASEMNDMDNAVSGTVTKSGDVMVDGKVVAHDAITAGRQNMAGSQTVTRSGQTFYVRPPKVSFASDSLSAFVVMKDGRFQHAVIASCGNPVKATPVTKKVVKKEVQQPVKQQVITQTVVVEKPAPPAPPPQTVVVTKEVPVPTPAPQPASLPATGSEDIISLGAFATIAGAVFHQLSQRRLFRK